MVAGVVPIITKLMVCAQNVQLAHLVLTALVDVQPISTVSYVRKNVIVILINTVIRSMDVKAIATQPTETTLHVP